MNRYEVGVTFGNYYGLEEFYDVYAKDADRACDKAIDMAWNDLEIIDAQVSGPNEWDVAVGFCGMIGVEITYNVNAIDFDDATEEALAEAGGDLTANITFDYQEDM